jgi:predicted acyltransferase
MIYLYLLWPVQLVILGISLFGCILCCKALALYLFSILFVVVVVVADDILDSAVLDSSNEEMIELEIEEKVIPHWLDRSRSVKSKAMITLLQHLAH